MTPLPVTWSPMTWPRMTWLPMTWLPVTWSPVTWLPRAAGVFLAAGALAALTACSSSPGDSASSARSGSPGEHRPPAALPSAGDGSDVGACADGSCEVVVGPSTKIPVPASAQVDSVSVQSVGPSKVGLTGHYLGDSQGGYCTGNCDSSGSGGNFQLSLGAYGEGSANRLDVTLLATDGKHAVLRLTLLDSQ